MFHYYILAILVQICYNNRSTDQRGRIMKHITIIEDDSGLNNGIVLALKQEDYSFRQLYRLSEFKLFSEKTPPDIEYTRHYPDSKRS